MDAVLGWEIRPANEYGGERYVLTAGGWDGNRDRRVKTDDVAVDHLKAFLVFVSKRNLPDVYVIDMAINSDVGGSISLQAQSDTLEDALAVAEAAFAAFLNNNVPEDVDYDLLRSRPAWNIR